MKFTERIFEKCGGRCCICNYALTCVIGCEDIFKPATKEELIRRVDDNEFPFHDAFIVGYLFGKYGCRYGED